MSISPSTVAAVEEGRVGVVANGSLLLAMMDTDVVCRQLARQFEIEGWPLEDDAATTSTCSSRRRRRDEECSWGRPRVRFGMQGRCLRRVRALKCQGWSVVESHGRVVDPLWRWWAGELALRGTGLRLEAEPRFRTEYGYSHSGAPDPLLHEYRSGGGTLTRREWIIKWPFCFQVAESQHSGPKSKLTSRLGRVGINA